MININFFLLSILIVLGIIIYENQNYYIKKFQNKDNFLNILNGKGSVNTYTPNLYYVFKKPFNLDDYF
jgi:hypothetical protein